MLNLSEKEKKTRKQWLIYFLALFVYQVIYLKIISSTIGIIFLHPAKVFLIQASTLLLLSIIQYYCIYVKYGTGWLTFLLFSIPIGLVLSIATLIFSPPSPLTPPLTPQILSMLFSLGYLIPCYRLRKVNQRIQHEKKQNPNG